ncbi:hypothetical protein ACF0H5_016434 [Mactra antiquata]
MSTFNVTRAQTASIQSTGFGVSLGSGLGFSPLAISAPVVVCEHFSGRRKLLLLSFLTTGGAVGGITYPFVLRFLSDMYGFRGALLILGGFTMNFIPMCLLWRQQSPKLDTQASTRSVENLQLYQQTFNVSVSIKDDKVIIIKNKQLSKENDVNFIRKFPVAFDVAQTKRISIKPGKVTYFEDTDRLQTLKQNLLSLITNVEYMVFLIGFVISFASLALIIIFIADMFKDKGLTVEDATLGLLIMNIFGVFGRILPGLLMQIKHLPTLFCPLLAALSGTFVLLGIQLTSSRTLLLMICAFNGIPSGVISTMFNVITAKLVDTKGLPTAIGLLFTASGIGNAIAGPVSGYLRDIYGIYSVPLYGAAGMTFLASFLFIVTIGYQTLQKRRASRVSSVYHVTRF